MVFAFNSVHLGSSNTKKNALNATQHVPSVKIQQIHAPCATKKLLKSKATICVSEILVREAHIQTLQLQLNVNSAIRLAIRVMDQTSNSVQVVLLISEIQKTCFGKEMALARLIVLKAKYKITKHILVKSHKLFLTRNFYGVYKL